VADGPELVTHFDRLLGHITFYRRINLCVTHIHFVSCNIASFCLTKEDLADRDDLTFFTDAFFTSVFARA